MPIENTLIAKLGGGLVAVGGATGAGIVYREDISKWFSPTAETATYFFVASQTGEKDTTTNDLYKDKKEKNYKCKLESKTYECDIVKKIDKTDAATKKWLNLNTNFSTENVDKDLTKTIFQTKNDLFLLKINTTDEIKFDDKKLFDVIENDDNTKKFGQLKPIFGKKNNELLGNVNLFLGQIKDFGESGGENWQIPTDATKKYNCGFGAEKTNLKECELYKFTSGTQNNLDAYTTLNFTGKLGEKLTNSTTLKKKEYYLIKFKDNLKNSDYSNKDLIYFETTDGASPVTKKIINFSSALTSFLFIPTSDTSEDNELLIINNTKATA